MGFTKDKRDYLGLSLGLHYLREITEKTSVIESTRVRTLRTTFMTEGSRWCVSITKGPKSHTGVFDLKVFRRDHQHYGS